VGESFVFWAVGVRLLIAGLRQVANPQFTAERIFNIKSAEPLPVVRELGFANTSTGIWESAPSLIAAGSCWRRLSAVCFTDWPEWGHAFKEGRNLFENVAMYSDRFVFIMLLVYVVATVMNW
jgi:hypothetical protein